jgi:hypothetical protein
MKARNRKRTNDGAILTSVAESIGAALGTIAAKADAAQKALTHSSMVRGVEREAKKIAQKGKRSARKTTRHAAATAARLKRSKAAKAGRRGLRRAVATVKRAARRR